MESNDRSIVSSQHRSVVQVLFHPPDVHCTGGHQPKLTPAAALEDGQQGVGADALPGHKLVPSQVPDMQVIPVNHQQLQNHRRYVEQWRTVGLMQDRSGTRLQAKLQTCR